jgi:hypothetical protein
MSKLRHLAQLSVLLACLSACSGPSLTTPAAEPAAPPAPTAVPDRATQELDILESVYRYQFEHNFSGRSSSSFEYVFLSRGGSSRVDNDPPAELLARFAGNSPPVEPWSACEIGRDGGSGVTLKYLGGRGIIFRLDHVRWIDDETVDVDGGYYVSSRGSSGNTYRAKLQGGRWVVVNDEQHWVS